MKYLKWVLGGLLLALGGFALVAYLLTRQKVIGQAAVLAIEAAHRPAIESAQATLDGLRHELDEQAPEVAKARAEVERRRQKLLDTYSTVGMSSEEVADRLVRLRL